MAAVDNVRNDIIAKLLTISNKTYLDNIYDLINKSAVETDVVHLTDEQILMLKLSEDDIKHGRVISQEALDEKDLMWLKEL